MTLDIVLLLFTINGTTGFAYEAENVHSCGTHVITSNFLSRYSGKFGEIKLFKITMTIIFRVFLMWTETH